MAAGIESQIEHTLKNLIDSFHFSIGRQQTFVILPFLNLCHSIITSAHSTHDESHAQSKSFK